MAFYAFAGGKTWKAAECNLEQSKAKGLMKLALRLTKTNSMFVVMEPARENYLKDSDVGIFADTELDSRSQI